MNGFSRPMPASISPLDRTPLEKPPECPAENIPM